MQLLPVRKGMPSQQDSNGFPIRRLCFGLGTFGAQKSGAYAKQTAARVGTQAVGAVYRPGVRKISTNVMGVPWMSVVSTAASPAPITPAAEISFLFRTCATLPGAFALLAIKESVQSCVFTLVFACVCLARAEMIPTTALFGVTLEGHPTWDFFKKWLKD